jgi:hypothetical protein
MKFANKQALSSLSLAALMVLSGALVGCGGDGDDGSADPFVTELDISAANSETVAHATAASVFAFGGASGAVPLSSGSDVSALATSARVSSHAARGSSAAWLPQRVVDALKGAIRTDRAQPLAVTTSPPEACAVAGTMTVTVDDRDNNGEFSLGDSISVAFSNCQDSTQEVLNGAATVVVTRIGATVLPSFGARMRLTQLSQEAADGRHGITATGDVVLDYEQTSASSEKTTLTADGNVELKVHTHQNYSDTVTLQPGFGQQAFYESGPGITRINAYGFFSSAAAGGRVVVEPLRTIEIADTEFYPMSGTVKVAGQGSLVLTVLSSSSVQIDLDADGDNSYESRQTQTWDWLF